MIPYSPDGLRTYRLRRIDPQAAATPAQRIAAYISEHIKTLTSLSDVCEHFHYSKNYVIRIFKKKLGVTPISYLNRARINRATFLLDATSAPLGEIAAECGFSDYPYFYKRFCEQTGISPSEWRQRTRHTHPTSLYRQERERTEG